MKFLPHVFLAFSLSVLAQAAAELPSKISVPTLPVLAMPNVEPHIIRRPLVLPRIERIVRASVFRPLEWAIEVNGLIDLYGNAENFGIAAVPENISLVKLRPRNPNFIDPNTYSEDAPVPLSEQDAAVLRTVLTCDRAYSWDDYYDCAPDYRFRVKFARGAQVVSVDICLGCHMVRVSKDGRPFGEATIEFGYESLARVVAHYYAKESIEG